MGDNMGVLIGVDYGHKKLGFAVGQTVTGNARPLTIVAQNGGMWQKIDAIFNEWQPQAVIIGEPKLADGKPHPLEKLIENFINDLKKRYNAAIYRENEALTSFEASSYQQGGERHQPVDAYAAALILESWMRCNNIK
ncbi:MAG: Holliday junction resolvase RuvX [Gammaproteobacteria bacterium]|nr:MAG: Holliday junction resolvase RuvX [Gammaproteobacteria bacterium]